MAAKLAQDVERVMRKTVKLPSQGDSYDDVDSGRKVLRGGGCWWVC